MRVGQRITDRHRIMHRRSKVFTDNEEVDGSFHTGGEFRGTNLAPNHLQPAGVSFGEVLRPTQLQLGLRALTLLSRQ